MGVVMGATPLVKVVVVCGDIFTETDGTGFSHSYTLLVKVPAEQGINKRADLGHVVDNETDSANDTDGEQSIHVEKPPKFTCGLGSVYGTDIPAETDQTILFQWVFYWI
jgi:hypothetical protein